MLTVVPWLQELEVKGQRAGRAGDGGAGEAMKRLVLGVGCEVCAGLCVSASVCVCAPTAVRVCVYVCLCAHSWPCPCAQARLVSAFMCMRVHMQLVHSPVCVRAGVCAQCGCVCVPTRVCLGPLLPVVQPFSI